MNEEAAFYDPPVDHKNRRTHILIGGIVLGLGGFLLLAAGGLYIAMPLILDRMMPGEMTEILNREVIGGVSLFKAIWVAGATMLSFAGFTCAAALGSIMMRRWCRVLALTLIWGWLYNGVTSILSYFTTFPSLMRAMMAFDEEPVDQAEIDSLIGVQMAMNIGTNLIFNVGIPAVLIWFYWGRHAKNTLKLSDSRARWTDPCPAPVLGLVWTALMILPTALTAGIALPLPWVVAGHPISGSTIQLVSCGLVLVWGYIAWGAYCRQAAAWIAALAMVCAGTFLSIDFSLNFDALAYLERFDLSEDWTAHWKENRESIEAAIEPCRKPFAILTVISMAPLIGYLIWIAPWFFGERKNATAS